MPKISAKLSRITTSDRSRGGRKYPLLGRETLLAFGDSAVPVVEECEPHAMAMTQETEHPPHELGHQSQLEEDDPPSTRPFASDLAVLERALRPSQLAPTAAAQCSAHLHAALGASLRAEARLGALFRALQSFSAGVSDAREANDQVARDFERMQELMNASSEEQTELRYRVAALEQALARAEQQAAREKEFLIDQQDSFIQLLCRDQEEEREELLRLRLERDQLRGDLTRIQAQRDEAQSAVVRIASERDEALIELSRRRVTPTPEAPDSWTASGPVRKTTRPPGSYSVAGKEIAEETLAGNTRAPER